MIQHYIDILKKLAERQPFYIAAVCFLGLGIFFPWFLFLAFICILPSLNENLEVLRDTLLRTAPQVTVVGPTRVTSESSRSQAVSAPLSNSAATTNATADSGAPSVPSKKLTPWGSETLRIRDFEGNILQVNSEAPVPYESEYFKGVILTMVRCEGGRWEKHFAGKQRKFEVQIQGKMKKLPTGNVMLGGELQEKIEFGLITRTLISILMRFAAKLLPSMRYSLGEAYAADGKYECPHVVSPIFRTMDRVWITPEGETPPPLGIELPEPDADRNLRRSGKGPELKFEMGCTYSFSFHSMYLDFGNWCITNIPGYKEIDLRTLVENQSISIVCYDIPFDPPGKTQKHTAASKKYLTFFEYCHISVMPEGELSEYNQFMATPIEEEIEDISAEELALPAAATLEAVAVALSPRASPSSTPGPDMHRESSGSDNEDDALTDVPSNSFLPITLLHEDGVAYVPPTLMDAQHNKSLRMQYEHNVWPGVGGKNGFAVVRDFQDVQSLKFIKLNFQSAAVLSPQPRSRTSMRYWKGTKSKKHSPDASGSLLDKDNAELPDDKFWKSENKNRDKLRNGDIVLVQSASTGEYLTIQRGWWLVWTSRAPQNRKGQFMITLTDYEERVRTDPAPLYVGFPFRLRSARWPTWQIGLQITPSQSYGGKLLTLYHTPKSSGDARHQSMDMSMSAFTKNMTSEAYSLPIYSSKSVRPLVLSILPDSVCERYSKETMGIIRSVMSLNAVRRDSAINSRLVPLGSLKGDVASTQQAEPVSNMFQHSSKISLPISMPRESITFEDYWNLPTQSNAITAPKSLSRPDYDTLSYRYFPKSTMNMTNLEGFHFEICGWVEVLNRQINRLQLAYLLTCEIPDELSTGEDYEITGMESDLEESNRVVFSRSLINTNASNPRARRFTILRTGKEIFETISAINDIQGSSVTMEKQIDRLSIVADKAPDMLKTASNDVSSVMGEPDLDLFMSPMKRQEKKNEDQMSDNSDEPSWAAADLFSNPNVNERESDFEFRSNYLGEPVGVICPRHQNDADHSYQLLSALLSMALKKELLIASTIKSAESVPEGQPSVENEISLKDGKAFDFPARRLMLTLAASSNDVLSESFVSEIVQLTPSASSASLKRSQRTNSVSSTDLVNQAKVSPLLRTTVVARALWDSHWREEFVQLHSSFISFFPVVSSAEQSHSGNKRKKERSPDEFQGSAISGPACLTLLLVDITSVSLLDEVYSKFPGYHILRLESLGRATYLAFNSLSQCESFAGYVLELKSEAMLSIDGGGADIISVEGVMNDPRDSFVLRSGRWRPQSRMILNSRRFYFDIDQQRTESILNNIPCTKPWIIGYSATAANSLPDSEGSSRSRTKSAAKSEINYWDLSVKLLRDISMLSTNTVRAAEGDASTTIEEPMRLMGTDRLISFLDDIGSLKLIDLIKIDFSSKEAVCFFGNIYHTLLLHARLVLGCPNDETWTTFFDTVSYEIGGDVFSLIELEQCVLRGKLSRPQSVPKVGYKLPLADDDRYAYALTQIDSRINFFITTGAISGSNKIVVLTPDKLDEQLNETSRDTLEFCLDINLSQFSICLPRVCYLYRNDFLTRDTEERGDLAVLEACLNYFGPAQSDNIANLLALANKESKDVAVKYSDADFKSYSVLTLN